jgi:hypothetical protein
MDNSRTQTPEDYREDRKRTGRNKTIGIIVITALVLLGALWIWKALEVRSVRNEAEAENERVRQTAANIITQSRTEQLRLLAKPFVWAVRAEMLRGNMDQVNLYLQDMVRERNFQRIEVADSRGVVIASTDKKNEGKPLADTGRLSVDTIVVNTLGDSAWTISSPIMGLDSRLGTLVIDYASPKPKL